MTGADAILDLARPVAGDGPAEWRITARRALCLGPPQAKHMSGGATLAAAIAALEATSGKPLICAGAQFIAAPALDETADITVETLQAGQSIHQARATLRVAGRERTTVNAALGGRPPTGDFDWSPAPQAPPPESCPPVPFVRANPGDLHTRLDMRLAVDERAAPSGRMLFWVRAPDQSALGAPFLAICADYAPEAIHMNIGRPAGAVSLDNSLRIIRTEPTDWVLCETRISAIEAGLFHAAMRLFTRQGRLLATAAQSGVVRLLEPAAV
jgi:acyl-CoA thioesterase II